MLCLADFILDSDLCLKEGAGSLKLIAPDDAFSLTLSNVAVAEAQSGAVLSAQLTFQIGSFENIRAIAYERLADALNVLTFTTNRKVALQEIKKVIDWTPGITDRQAVIYHTTLEWDRAEPELVPEFVETAERFLAMHSGEEQKAAMRWYRRGIEAEQLEDQFSYFWFALEIAAEATKGSEKVASKCPRCNEPLFCENCGNRPLHRRYPGEAIQEIIHRVHPADAGTIFRELQSIRHTLMHGGRIASIVDLSCTDQDAVNKLAFVTWGAISLMFDKPDPWPESPMTCGYTENLVRRTLIASAHVTVTLPGDPNNPQLSDFPLFKTEIIKTPVQSST